MSANANVFHVWNQSMFFIFWQNPWHHLFMDTNTLSARSSACCLEALKRFFQTAHVSVVTLTSCWSEILVWPSHSFFVTFYSRLQEPLLQQVSSPCTVLAYCRTVLIDPLLLYSYSRPRFVWRWFNGSRYHRSRVGWATIGSRSHGFSWSRRCLHRRVRQNVWHRSYSHPRSHGTRIGKYFIVMLLRRTLFQSSIVKLYCRLSVFRNSEYVINMESPFKNSLSTQNAHSNC